MKHTNKISKSALITLALALLLAGCANRSDGIKPPALPDAAKVSKVPMPLICSQGCLSGWSRAVEKSANMLID